MPTHQGKTQTDIVIGDGGDSTQMIAEMSILAVGADDLQFAESTGSAEHDSALELVVVDATGGVVATVYASLAASPTLGSAAWSTLSDASRFNPAADGSSPTTTSPPDTSAERVWAVDVDDPTGLFGGFAASWLVEATGSTGSSVSQVVKSQTDSELCLNLICSLGRASVLEVDLTCAVRVSAGSSLMVGSPSVDDTFVS